MNQKTFSIIFATLLLACTWSLHAQKWIERMDEVDNFQIIQKEFYEEWADKEYERGRGYKQFKRWEWFMEPRTFPTGQFQNPMQLWLEMDQLKSSQPEPDDENKMMTWTPLGPTTWNNGNGWNPGLGRINVVFEDPNNSNTIYAGAPSGGLWRSQDGGTTWTNLTDDQPVLGVSGIAVQPGNSNIIYIGTGDGDGADTYSVGVLKSIDGGVTWNTTGLNWGVTQFRTVRRLLMHPTNFNILFAATSSGLYKTSNAGTTWTLVQSGSMQDVEFHPTNSDIVYTCTDQVYRSTNGGDNFTLSSSGIPSGSTINRLKIAVSPDQPDWIYAIGGNQFDSTFEGLYRSTDSGQNWTIQSTSPNIFGYATAGDDTAGQSWYDLALAVDPNDANRVFSGGINVWISTNGGVNWTINTQWFFPNNFEYVHADIHELAFYGNNLYCGSDGAISVTSNLGVDWTDLTAGIQIMQFYKIGGTEQNPDLVVGGAQDNGTNLYTGAGSAWTHMLGADGMDCLIDYSNSNIIYGCIQNGSLRKSTNGGANFSTIATPNNLGSSAAWVTPYQLDPIDPNIIYLGYAEVFKSTNGGSTWSAISSIGGGTIRVLKVAPSDPNTIYISKSNLMYKTNNGGTSWTNISAGLPGLFITDFAIDPDNEDRIWATHSGYSNNTKVYHSNDGGSTWTNMSAGLPNLPANCVTYHPGSNDKLYLGMDVGIYTIDASMGSWQSMSNGLPNVIINEIEVNYANGLLRAGSYGRGLWEFPLPGVDDFEITATPNTQIICVPNNAVYDIAVSSVGNFSGNVTLSVSGVPAGATSAFSVNPVAAPGNSQLTISNTASAAPGTYTLTVTGTGTTGVKTQDVILTIANNTPAAISLSAPANGANDINTSPTLEWLSDNVAESYEMDIATDVNFNNVIENQTGILGTSTILMNNLNISTTYYWRVRGVNNCGNGAYSATWSFITKNVVCNNYISSDVPVTIPTTISTVTSTLSINDSGTIDDLNVTNLLITHTWVDDLIIDLTSPAGTTVRLMEQPCDQEDNIDISLDDESPLTYNSFPCPPTNGGIYQAFELLSNFDGEDLNGTWILTINDIFNNDGGTLDNWELDICYTPNVSAPLSVNVSGVNVNCNGANNGSATATVTGGTPPYSYLWNNGATTASIAALGGGNYSVTVTDAAGVTASDITTITEPPVLNLSATFASTTCGFSNGTATATASGGTPGYTYLWDNGATTATVSNLAAGTYLVGVADANGCTAQTSVTIGNSQAIIVTTTETHVSCHGGSDGVVIAGATSGSGSYSYSWNTGAMTSTITGLGAGSYSVTATDDLGCTGTAIATITEPPALTLNLSSMNATCGQQNGSITATPAGGTPGYTYLWNTGATTATISNLLGGTYFVTVTDANECTVEDMITIQETPAFSLGVSTTHTSCNLSNGAVTAITLGGTPSFTYLWNTGATTSTISNLAPGTYSVIATDANGCTASASATVSSSIALFLSSTSSDVSCNGGNNGSGTVSVIVGSPPYTYLWNNGQTTATAINLSAGTYFVTVTDANGCTSETSAIVGQPSLLLTSINTTNTLCNGSSDGSATVTANGGSPGYTYLWNNGQTTATAINLSAGTYFVTVTDANGCTSANSATVGQPNLLITTTSSNNTLCNGSSDGSATVTANGGSPGYTYLWNNGQTTATAINLSTGTYFVTVTDANGCTSANSATVGQPSLLLTSINTANTLCNGSSDGSATVTANGSTPPYTYLWNNGQITATAINLSAGTYFVTVTDANGCTSANSATVGQPNLLITTTSSNNTLCNGSSDGSATVTANGGSPGYTYLWNNGQTTATAINLSAGTYFVTVTDVNGCTSANSATVGQPSTLLSATSSTNTLCNGSSDGNAAVTINGGTPGYTYLWSDGQTTAIASNLSAGTYFVTVTDANGCTISNSAVVGQPPALTTVTVSTNTLCNGSSDGGATVTVGGGTPGYSYLWSDGQITATASNLSAGTYFVTITDANGCTVTTSAIVNQPTSLLVTTSSTNVLCNGSNDGTATASASGGTSPYSYIWNTGQTTATITNLSPNNYSVTVTDANGCTNTSNTTVNETTVLTTIINATDVLCNGNSDGTATAIPVGGTAPYSYLWSDGQLTATATNLNVGTYFVTITDINGCTTSNSTTISEPLPLTTATAVAHVICNGGNNGIGAVVVFGGTPGYTYLWNNGQTAAIATNLSAGTYFVTVTDVNGCTSVNSIVVNGPSPIVLNTVFTNTTCGSNNGTASVIASGGTPGYTYFWSNGQTTTDISNLSPGTYAVTATDASGCTNSASLNIAPSSNLPTTLTAASDTFSDGSGALDYVNSTDCEWLIQPPGAFTITLDFTAFDIESTFDFVRVYDGSTAAAPLLGEYSGNTIPASVTSTGGSMFVKFTSNTSGTAPGWDAFYQAEACLSDWVIPENPIPFALYEAENSITSSGRVIAGSNVLFDAGTEITLENNFEVELMAIFEAKIGGCIPPPMTPPAPEQLQFIPTNHSNIASVKFILKDKTQTALQLFDLAGNPIKTLSSSNLMAAGPHQVLFDLNDLPKGVYLLILDLEGKKAIEKVVVY